MKRNPPPTALLVPEEWVQPQCAWRMRIRKLSMAAMGFSRKFSRIFLALTIFAAALCYSGILRAQDPAANQLYEQKIKAGLLYNFLKYTSWPQDLEGSLKVCLYGSDPFEGYLYPLKGRTAQQYTISIQHIHDVSQAAECNIVFIHHNEARSLPALLKFLQDKHVMTASDIEEFAYKGGMVEFSRKDNRIKVFINKKAVEDAGLYIDNRLLKLATLVSSDGG